MKQQEQSSPWNLDIQYGPSSKSRNRLPRLTKSLGLIASAHALPPQNISRKPSRTRISGLVISRVLRMIELGALLRATCISTLVLHTTSLILNPRETSSTTDGTTWGDQPGQYILQGCLRIMRHAFPLCQKSHALGDPGFWMTDGGFREDQNPRSLYPLLGQGSGLATTNATNTCCSLADALEARIHLTNFGPP